MQPDAQFWSTLKKRLAAECPPAQPELLAYSVPTWMHRKPPGQYNFRTSTADRLGLLHGTPHVRMGGSYVYPDDVGNGPDAGVLR
eukprot:scaffold874_cov380-Prasinococcus_capsulatus_cf.AAC.12